MIPAQVLLYFHQEFFIVARQNGWDADLFVSRKLLYGGEKSLATIIIRFGHVALRQKRKRQLEQQVLVTVADSLGCLSSGLWPQFTAVTPQAMQLQS